MTDSDRGWEDDGQGGEVRRLRFGGMHYVLRAEKARPGGDVDTYASRVYFGEDGTAPLHSRDWAQHPTIDAAKGAALVLLPPDARRFAMMNAPAPADLANLATVARALRTLGLDVPAGVVDAAAREIATMRARSLLTVATVPAVDPLPASADVCAARHAAAKLAGVADGAVACPPCEARAGEPCKGAETWETSAALATRLVFHSDTLEGCDRYSVAYESIYERDRQVLARLDAALVDHAARPGGTIDKVADLAAELRRSAS